MKAILEFNLPEEANEHKQAVQGADWEYALFELDQHLRGLVKYGDDEALADFAQKIRDRLYEILNESGLIFSP